MKVKSNAASLRAAREHEHSSGPKSKQSGSPSGTQLFPLPQQPNHGKKLHWLEKCAKEISFTNTIIISKIITLRRLLQKRFASQYCRLQREGEWRYHLKSQTAASEGNFASFSTMYCSTCKSSQPKLMGVTAEPHTPPNKHQRRLNNLALV